jgi:hypothetical protein
LRIQLSELRSASNESVRVRADVGDAEDAAAKFWNATGAVNGYLTIRLLVAISMIGCVVPYGVPLYALTARGAAADRCLSHRIEFRFIVKST